MMNNNNTVDNATKHPADELIAEWKRRKGQDEKAFLMEINDPEHQKRIELIRGKTVKNESASA